MTRKRPRSLVRMGDKDLPERIPVYNRRDPSDVSMVPTALLGQMLGKRDREGQPVFVMERPDGPMPTYIEETCDICLRRGVRKRFAAIVDMELHYEYMHEREWAIRLRERDRQERQEDRRLLLNLLKDRPPATAPEQFPCVTCNFQAKSAFGLRTHERSHK